jgi:hypothetical protein
LYFFFVELRGVENREKKKFKKKLDNTKKISTFAIPNTGSLINGVDQGIKKIETLQVETESWTKQTREKQRSECEEI